MPADAGNGRTIAGRHSREEVIPLTKWTVLAH
jgi:hypothetical protein